MEEAQKQQKPGDKPKNKGGRPRKKIDVNVVKKLAMLHCTQEEIAGFVGVSVDTIQRRFAATIKESEAIGKTSLKRWMWSAAENGNITMQIWLSKNILGYSDKTDLTSKGKQINQMPQVVVQDKKTKDELLAMFSGDLKRKELSDNSDVVINVTDKKDVPATE